MRANKTFEISTAKTVYFGEYWFEDNKLRIDEVHSFDEDGKKIEIDSINDPEQFNKIYSLVEKDKMDELHEYQEEEKFDVASGLRDFGAKPRWTADEPEIY